jgi:hypothetical protein
MSVEIIGFPQTSKSGDAIKVTSYADDFVSRGNAFLMEKNFDIVAGATINLLFDYTTFVHDERKGEIGHVYVLPPNFGATTGPVSIILYRDTNYTGGTPITLYNPNTLAAKLQSATTITQGATGVTKGTLTLQYLVGGDKGQSGLSTGLSFFIRDNTKRSLVEITNHSNQTVTFHYGQLLFEI